MTNTPKGDAPRSLFDWLGFREYPDFTKARPLGALVGVLLILVYTAAILSALGLLGYICAVIVSDIENLLAGNTAPNTTQNLGIGTLLAGFLSAPFFLYGMWLKHRTVEFQKEGHITDRINKAVEMLGAEKVVKDVDDRGQSVERTVPNIEVRIGALLALERIAQDSTRYDFGRDHVRVMEILCAYMRENSPAPRDLNEHQPPDVDQNTRSRTDIALCVDVIKRRNYAQREIEKAARYRLDLRRVDFSGCDLSNGNFDGALMHRCLFNNQGRISRASLVATDFMESLFLRTYFRICRINGTVFSHCSCPFSSLFFPGEIESAVIIASKIPLTYIAESDSNKLIGSLETVTENVIGKNTAIIIKEFERKFENGKDIADNLHKEYQKFKYWTPYTSNDWATHEYWTKFVAAHNLTGWPFDDT